MSKRTFSEYDQELDYSNEDIPCISEPICRGSRSTLCGDIDCVKCFERSFAFHEPEKTLCWSINNDLKPNEVFRSCNKKFLFNCNRCLHSFWKSPNTINSSGNGWCGICDNKFLCGKGEDCRICHEKTFLFKQPEKALCWSSKNVKGPDEVFSKTAVKYYFDCNECGHELYISPHKISVSGRWCRYCTNQALCGKGEDCSICHEKTFAYHDPEKSLHWSSKNKKTPDQVFRCDSKKFIFDCGECKEEFEMILMNISKRGDWCTNCSPRSKYEEAIKTKLETLENIKIDKEQTIKLNNRFLRWDFVVKTDTTTFHIETDGSQHFFLKNYMSIIRCTDLVEGLKKFKDQRARDLLKEDYIKRTNGLLFRVSYRQLKQIPQLVDKMVQYSKNGRTGVVYMDNIYADWGPIE